MPVDFRGNTIEVGDTVLYPRQMGDTLEMQEGTVLEIKGTEDTRSVRPPGWVFSEESRRDWITETYTKYKYKVQPTRSSRYNRNEFERDWQTGQMIQVKSVWIQNGMNVVRADDARA